MSPAGYPVHVVQRGVNRATCFCRDSDYLCYLQLLSQYSRAFACAVHAYVLMPNHVHLLLTPGESVGISLLMKHVAQLYTQYVNRTWHRSGPLWEGRFKSSVIVDDAYLLACYRYIEMNPVRARLADDAAHYAWSSHRANAGVAVDTLVKRHPLYIGLASHDEACAAAYRQLFESSPRLDREQQIRNAVERELPVGRGEFRFRLLASMRLAATGAAVIAAAPAQNGEEHPTTKSGI
ncbi:MAG TPA: transposase [Burkholderiales bacterium]|nr:transposase [Burkholderiales bacterium]